MDQDLDDIYEDNNEPTYDEIEDLLLPTQTPPPKFKLIITQEILLSTFDHELKRNQEKK
jgi:hypothetical protein